MSLLARYGEWAVVAGASEGTGRAFARRLAAAGVPSLLVGRREAPLAALAGEIRADTGVACEPLALDLSRADAADRLADAAAGREVGLFVANAGSDPHGARFLDADADKWRDLVQRNVLTTMLACHRFAAPMRDRGRGGLLLVSSGACYGGSSTLGPYAGSKAFILCFAEALWAELRPAGVDVLTLVLNRTDTPALRQLLADKGVPVPADLADPDEVARVGLERLPHGPVHNWGQADDEAGMSNLSAAARRERVLAIDRVTAELFGRP